LVETIIESVSYLQVPVKNLEESTEWYIGNDFFDPSGNMLVVNGTSKL
jgi:hypothetical protein